MDREGNLCGKITNTTTRGKAYVSLSGYPVIMVEHVSGYVLLEHLVVRTNDEEA